MKKKILLGGLAAAALLVIAPLAAGTANAADGDQFIVTAISRRLPLTGWVDDPNHSYGSPSVQPVRTPAYDPACTRSPPTRDLSTMLAHVPEGDPQLIVNGFTDDHPDCLAAGHHPADVCCRLNIYFHFRQEATNVLSRHQAAVTWREPLGQHQRHRVVRHRSDHLQPDPSHVVQSTVDHHAESPRSVSIMNNGVAFTATTSPSMTSR